MYIWLLYFVSFAFGVLLGWLACAVTIIKHQSDSFNKSNMLKEYEEIRMKKEDCVFTCTQCSGSGVIEIKTNDGEYVFEDCQDCDGNGYVIETIPSSLLTFVADK